MNFVDLDELENSLDALAGNLHLKDLYMMGNPCQVHQSMNEEPLHADGACTRAPRERAMYC